MTMLTLAATLALATTTTHKVHDFGATPAPGAISDTTEVRTFVVADTIENPPFSDCDSVFDKIDGTLREGAPANGVDVDGSVGCGWDDDLGRVTMVSYNYALEARTEADVPAFEAWIASVQGRPAWGTTLSYVRVFSLLSDATLAFYDLSAPDDSPHHARDFASVDQRALHLNMKQQYAWVIAGAERLMADDVADALAWIGAEFGAWATHLAESDWLPRANYVKYTVTPTYILEDRTLAWPSTVFSGGARDCREAANGRCL